MYSIYVFLTIALVCLNITGLTVLALRWIPDAGIARTSGILAVGFALFFVEHFIGLGRITWLWPLTSAISCVLIWRGRALFASRPFRADLWVFGIALAYGVIWRWRFPNIDGGTEHLTDLLFIANYLPGDTLPSADHWLPGYAFDFYYGWQHYAAALMGRMFNLPPGMTMNLACAVLMALTASLAWSVTGNFIQKTWPKVLLVMALLVGGNGLSPLLPVLISSPTPTEAFSSGAAHNRFWAGVRFSGMYDEQVNTSLGKFLGLHREKGQERYDLPQEGINFYAFLGDYHPPLGGFAMMLYGLGLMGLVVRREKIDSASSADEAAPVGISDQLATALLAASPVLLLAINAWVFPLQVFLALAGFYWLHSQSRLDWRAVLMGGGAALLLIFPYFTYFAPAALPSPIKFVVPSGHTEPAIFIAMHWPVLLLLVCGLVMAWRTRWALYLTLLLLGILVVSEMFYINDQLGGLYDRFNTTIKWWSWLWPAALIGLGSMAWTYGGRFMRGLVTFIACAVLIVPLADTLIWWSSAPAEIRGKYAGDAWLKQETAHHGMLNYLKTSPKGILLEDPEGGAYNNSSAFALFTGHLSAIGWPGHEYQWRGNAGYVNERADAARAFYRGELADAAAWLQHNRVNYIVWTSGNDAKKPGVWAQIHAQIGQDYVWQGFRESETEHWGIWERRPQPALPPVEAKHLNASAVAEGK